MDFKNDKKIIYFTIKHKDKYYLQLKNKVFFIIIGLFASIYPNLLL